MMSMPMLLAAAGCSGQAASPDAQATSPGVALPAAGAADAVRTAKPGTAPAAGTTASPTPVASATP